MQLISTDSFVTKEQNQSQEHQPKLFDRLRITLRSRHYSHRTEQTYSHWVKRFINFHNVRHPAEMAEPEISAFLTHLAVKEKVKAIHTKDIAEGWGRVNPLSRKSRWAWRSQSDRWLTGGEGRNVIQKEYYNTPCSLICNIYLHIIK